MMTEYFTSFFSLFFSAENQILIMFFSGFLSSTILPGNSEIIFMTLASKNIMAESPFSSYSLWELVVVATLGNSLGGIVTYAMGLLFPSPKQMKHRYAKWALAKSEKYGVLVLLFSWLPMVGDIFCAIAGWLRLSWWQSVICILIGKLVRYLFLTVSLYSIFYTI